MGTVYLAEREDHFKQRVALKTVHAEEVSTGLLQRFYAERQILADLNHPHIARIFDGGATQGTLPFFVMEYVEGEPFDRACAKLDLRQKLELFQKVCAAVHHAHQNLIVHRDLKPSNILVTADGEPKLLDFGIAKLLRHESAERDGSQKKRPDLGPMTIAFASPEQLKGDPINISTDIYSLGVLLYLILSGKHPYHEPEIETPDLVRIILHDEPVPPSRAAGAETQRAIAGDLDMITLQCLEKSPEDRYDSAAQLAEEIRRHLDDYPIRAWRGTRFGRLRKAVRRHKLLAASVVFLLLFSTTITVLWRYAVQQEIEAKQAQSRSERTRDFILDFFKSVEPDLRPGTGIDLEQIVDRGRESLEDALHDEPEVRADLLGTLAMIYHALALYDEALKLQEEAAQQRRLLRPVDRRKLAIDLNNLANSYYSRKDFEKAERIFRESLPHWKRLGDPYELNAMANLAAVLVWQGRVPEAVELLEEALTRANALSMESTLNAAALHFGLGVAHLRLEKLSDAEGQLRKALSIYSSDPQAKPSRLAQVESSLGEVLQAQGRLSDAHRYLESALGIRSSLFGERHLRTAGSQKKLALLLIEQGELSSAEVLLEKAGRTYSALGNEAGAAEIRRAQERLFQSEGHPAPIEDEAGSPGLDTRDSG